MRQKQHGQPIQFYWCVARINSNTGLNQLFTMKALFNRKNNNFTKSHIWSVDYSFHIDYGGTILRHRNLKKFVFFHSSLKSYLRFFEAVNSKDSHKELRKKFNKHQLHSSSPVCFNPFVHLFFSLSLNQNTICGRRRVASSVKFLRQS